MDKIFNKKNLVTCALLLPLIAMTEGLLFACKFPAWPVMLSIVAFFLAEQEREKLGHIVLGGAIGELSILFLYLVYVPSVWQPSFGTTATATFIGVIVFVLIFVGLIVLLTDVLPKFFNSFTFLFFLAGTLGIKSDAAPGFLAKTPVPLVWMAETLVGGTLLILGCVAIGSVVKKAAAK
ncbi:MAG: hypothetical protein LBP60_01495 [Spirochaetaceae bacterium]|jgi:hypothetical protein|nr:hypothetical protein [Spirochaetaceae bacterium]